jgi:hypothetical protein
VDLLADVDLRRFLFHTALASGVPPTFPPFAAAEVRGVESLRPLPDFATSRGLGADKDKGAAGTEPTTPLSPGLAKVVPVEPLAARNVLFTETALNDFGLTVEADRPWPFSSVWLFEVSAFVASVSDPPLTLTSAELTTPSPPSLSGLSASLLKSSFT